jgi:hypothetical protein
MAKRDIDPSFARDELLWRRIEKGDVRKDKTLKPQAFRLQVSLVRERHGNTDQVCDGKFNGIAEAKAAEVQAIKFGLVRVECVDEPTTHDNGQGHCLAAVVLTPGDEAPLDVKLAARSEFANVFKVCKDPS